MNIVFSVVDLLLCNEEQMYFKSFINMILDKALCALLYMLFIVVNISCQKACFYTLYNTAQIIALGLIS